MEIKANDVLNALSRHIGSERGTTAAELVFEITGERNDPHLERQLRYAIVRLRREGYHICAHPSAGYYIASNDAELNETCEYLYHRAICSLEQISAMKRISLPDLRGQLKLPT